MLDTLTDLANCANTALSQMGFPTHPKDKYRYFIGDGLRNLIKRILPENHRDGDTIEKCLVITHDQYHCRWAENTHPYSGIAELLSGVDQIKLPKVIFSNKPDEFTQVMVKDLLADFSFEIVRGLNRSTPRKPDPTVPLQIADQLKIPPRQFLYLGDTNTDMKTAIAADMYPVGALWGFRTAEELKANGAKALAKHPLDVLNILNSSS